MQKNLPFVSVSIIEDTYTKRILPFIDQIDNGNFFKKLISWLLQILAFGMLLGGIYLSIAGLFGDSGFIESTLGSDGLSGGKKAGAAVGLILGFSISILTAWVAYSFIRKRISQYEEQPYEGLLKQIFYVTFPKLIIIVGELTFILLLYVGVGTILANLINSAYYAPLAGLGANISDLMPIGSGFIQVPDAIIGDYDTIDVGMVSAITIIVGACLTLIAYYIYREIYKYILKLVVALISFLPKFAIPLAIRQKTEN